MAEAFISSEILKWARERAGFPHEVLAQKVGSAPEKIIEWEEGASRPTFRQAEKLANVVRIPFAYLFLSSPPEEQMPLPDLRTVAGTPLPKFDVDFMDLINDILFKHDWFYDYLVDHGATALPFVGKFSLPVRALDVAKDILDTLHITSADRNGARDWEDYFSILVKKAEDAGIWVIRSGVVGNNTHRPLSVNIFRGFAISNPIIPLVFVNGKDAKAAQIFTLIHELAHIWLGESGVSDPFRAGTGSRRRYGSSEEFCNAVAAEFLLPRTDFREAWDEETDMEINIRNVASKFKVSRIVVAIRGRELGFINEEIFAAYFEAEKDRWRRDRENTEGGGDYYRTAKTRSGNRFFRAVLSSAISGDLLLRNAGTLLGMSPKSIFEAHRRQKAGVL